MATIELYESLLQAKRDADLNADYASVGSLSKARKFSESITRLILMLPRKGNLGGTGGEAVEFDLAMLEKLQAKADKWIQCYQSAQNAVTYQGFEYYRS